MIMFPSYSPLFTMGLLAEHVPPSSPPALRNAFDDPSTIYFTLHADTLDLRSFLYLDLADNKQLPLSSHRRRLSTLSKSTSWTCSADVKSIYDSARFVTVRPHTPAVPARRRTSKESLRSIPSPKPAPSTTLPELPISPGSPPSSTPSKKRPASSVIISLPSPTLRVRRPTSLRSVSVSSQFRRKSRMDALACLEGRSRAPKRASALRSNFMSFSDDEDEKSTMRTSSAPTMAVVHSEDLSAFADVEDEVDAILPTPPHKRAATDKAKHAQSAGSARQRRSTLESWFPLKSFIDLKEDDLSSWNWRSFIEIGGVS